MPWITWFMTDRGHHLPKTAAAWVVWFGRAGFASRGLIYLGMGALAAMATFGMGGEVTDTQGTVEAFSELPMGQVLVMGVALGLAGYGLWRVAQGVLNLDHYDESFESSCYRGYFLIDGLFHAAWAVLVFTVLLQPGGQNDGESARAWTAELMNWPAGRWLVGLAGLAVIGTGVYLFSRACTHTFRDEWEDSHIGRAVSTGAMVLARFGETARGVVFALLGFFLIRAAWRFDPDEARGLGESMLSLVDQPFGRMWLGLVALGLIAYGLSSFMDAMYRRFGRGQDGAKDKARG